MSSPKKWIGTKSHAVKKGYSKADVRWDAWLSLLNRKDYAALL